MQAKNFTDFYNKEQTQKIYLLQSKKVNLSRYRPGVAQRVGRGIALLFHDHGN